MGLSPVTVGDRTYPSTPLNTQPQAPIVHTSEQKLQLQQNSHGSTRYQNTSAQKTAQQGHMGATRTRRMICSSENAPLALSYILHTQDSFRMRLRYDGVLLSAKSTPKPVPSGYSYTSVSGHHRGYPEPSPDKPNQTPWRKT